MNFFTFSWVMVWRITLHCQDSSWSFFQAEDGRRDTSVTGVQTCALPIWEDFTNDEIANYFRQWVKHARPKQIKAPSGKGHKPGDWRALLTRLGVMRLLSRFTLQEILGTRSAPPVIECQPIHRTKQFASDKWGDPAKWHDARREAGKVFRTLFPFLPKDVKPISWERQSPGK